MFASVVHFQISAMLGTPTPPLLPNHSSLSPSHLLTDVHGTNAFSSEPVAGGKRGCVIVEDLESSQSLACEAINAEHTLRVRPVFNKVASSSRALESSKNTGGEPQRELEIEAGSETPCQ